jgi:hypothetical protein
MGKEGWQAPKERQEEMKIEQKAVRGIFDNVPYSVDYGVYTLYVERLQGDGKFNVLQTFQQKGLYSTYNGIPLGGRGHHPAHAVIEDAVKWLSAGGLSDPTRGSNLMPNTTP